MRKLGKRVLSMHGSCLGNLMSRALILLIAISASSASFAGDMRDCTEGDTETTIVGCSKVIADNPVKEFRAVAFANRAGAYRQKGESQKVIDDLDAAIAADPKWGYVYRERGATYARQGAFLKAREDIDKSLVLEQYDASTFYLSCQLWIQAAEYEKGVSDCSKMIELDPRAAKGYVFRGQSHWFKAEFREAADDLFRAVLIDRSSAQTYAMLGECYIKLGDSDHALEALDSALSLEPKLLPSLVSRGTIYQMKGEKEKAEADYRTALAVSASDEFSRKLQRAALDGLTALQAQETFGSTLSKGQTNLLPQGADQKKQTMCEFADADRRKAMGCN